VEDAVRLLASEIIQEDEEAWEIQLLLPRRRRRIHIAAAAVNNSERKCAYTIIGTALVPLAGNFQC